MRKKPVPNGNEFIVESYYNGYDYYDVTARLMSDGSYQVISRSALEKESNPDMPRGKYFIISNDGNFYHHDLLSWRAAFSGDTTDDLNETDMDRSWAIDDVNSGNRLAHAGCIILDIEDLWLREGFSEVNEYINALKNEWETDDTITTCARDSQIVLYDSEGRRRNPNSFSVLKYCHHHKGCLADYFSLDDICDAYASNKIVPPSSAIAKLEELWHTEIEDLAIQSMEEIEYIYTKTGLMIKPPKFTLTKEYANSVQRIVRGLLLGFPVEYTAAEMER